MSNKRSCKKYDRMIEYYIDGLLSEKDAEKLEAHVAECKDCRTSLLFSMTLRQMARASAEKVPQEIHDKIMAQAVAYGRRNRLVKRGALFAACMLIFVSTVAVWAMLPGKQSAEAPPPENGTYEETMASSIINASSSSEAPEKIETDALPTPEIGEPAEGSFTVEEELLPGNAADPEAEKSDEEMAEATQAEEATMALPEAGEAAEATDAPPDTHASPDAAPPIAESLGAARPGGEDITLALLIVSGLLAVASFIAFLISLSSVRRIPSKKDKE